MQTDELVVSPEQLRQVTEPASLGFSTTAELSDVAQNVTQERAIDAVSFGVGIPSQGYNVFVMGGPGHGRHRIVSSILKPLGRSGRRRRTGVTSTTSGIRTSRVPSGSPRAGACV